MSGSAVGGGAEGGASRELTEHGKTISGGARQAKPSLDSAVSSLLALISREW